MDKYFIKDGDKLRLYHGGITCDCYKTSWDNAKENKNQLLKMGYIEVK